MDEQKWTCTCGKENDGAFCSSCGSAKDGSQNVEKTDSNSNFAQFMMFQRQMQQQQIEAENERKRQEIEAENKRREQLIAHQKEQRRKMLEFEAAKEDYQKKCADISIKHLKKWGSSWIVIVLSCLVTLTMLFTIISTFTNFSIISVIKNIVNIIISILVVGDFWMTFAQARKSTGQFNVTGIKILHGVVIYKAVVMHIGMSLLTIIAFIIVALIAGVSGSIGGFLGGEFEELSLSISGFLVLIFLAIVFYWLIQGLYYASINKFARESVRSFSTSTVTINQNIKFGSNTVQTTKSTKVAVFFFIIGGVSLITSILQLTVLSTIGAIINQIASSENGEFMQFIFGSLGSILKIDIFSHIVGFVNALTYIFGGILSIQFNRLNSKIDAEREALVKPTMSEE